MVAPVVSKEVSPSPTGVAPSHSSFPAALLQEMESVPVPPPLKPPTRM